MDKNEDVRMTAAKGTALTQPDPSTPGSVLRAAVVDDEAACRLMLKHLLAKHCPEVAVIAECESVDEAVRTLPVCSPDLVFLDIMLTDGTGFDLLQQLETVPFKVVFTTAHDTFAIRAIRFSALDYLLKPIQRDELVSAVARASETSQATRTHSSQLRLLHDNLAATTGGDTQIALPTLDGFIFVTVHDIVDLEANGNYTTCSTTQGETHLICRTLKEFDDLLADHGFFRIHHSHSINLRHLRRYIRGKGGYVIMSSGKELEVSVRRREEFIAQLGMR